MRLFAAHSEPFPLITGGTTLVREFILTFLCLSTDRKTEPEQSSQVFRVLRWVLFDGRLFTFLSHSVHCILYVRKSKRWEGGRKVRAGPTILCSIKFLSYSHVLLTIRLPLILPNKDFFFRNKDSI
jgi:hypothetical protein